MSIKASIDIGTNSTKLLVVDSASGIGSPMADEVVITKLGAGARERGTLDGEAMRRTAEVVRGMCDRSRGLGADEIRIVGTECLRRAANASDLADDIFAACGVRVEIISGAREAELAFAAARDAVRWRERSVDTLCFFDIGGGSSEVVVGDGSGMRASTSIPIGALALSDLDKKTDEAIAFVRHLCEEHCDGVRVDDVSRTHFVAAGGSVVAMGAVMRGIDRRDFASLLGASITTEEARRQASLYESMPPSRRAEIKGLTPGRADTILGGACVLLALMLWSGAPAVSICTLGLRHALAAEMTR